MFSKDDLLQFANSGITLEEVESQLRSFKKGFPYLKLIGAATLRNGGILPLSEKKAISLAKDYDSRSKPIKVLKFVPASGAATRMFSDLYSFNAQVKDSYVLKKEEFPSVYQFFEKIDSFAFFSKLKDTLAKQGLDLVYEKQHHHYHLIIDHLLSSNGLDYGSLPKALIEFHQYGDISRTPFEEHLVEGSKYASSSDGYVRIHFTISHEHTPLFEKKIQATTQMLELLYNVKFLISLSEQKASTNTLAVLENNEPLRDGAGQLIFRPAGHGALINNLNECDADLIFIKNIDNVLPDTLKRDTILYKKALGGLLLKMQRKLFSYLGQLEDPTIPSDLLIDIAKQATKGFQISLSANFSGLSHEEKRKELFAKLNRPIRVCGMVKNSGEAGGGPFYIEDSFKEKSLQIVEKAQVDPSDEKQMRIFQSSTHFNPVDLVCATRDYKGNAFDLKEFVDPETAFITQKNKDGVPIKAMELPGLWNGAMANWISLFVEVPLSTFSPVKNVNDLLRPEHQHSLIS